MAIIEFKKQVHKVTQVDIAVVDYTDGYGKKNRALVVIHKTNPEAPVLMLSHETGPIRLLPASKWLAEGVKGTSVDTEVVSHTKQAS